MKKRVVCFMITCMIISLGTAWSKAVKKPSYWKTLSKSKKSVFVHFLVPYDENEKFVTLPTLLPRPELSETKRFSAKITDVEKILNETKVNEPVSVEILDQWRNPLTKLGTYKPEKTGAKWDLPQYRLVKIPREYIRKLLYYKLKKHHTLIKSQRGTLVFRDSRGEVQASVKMRFYLPFKYKRPQLFELDQIMINRREKKSLKFALKQEGKLQEEAMWMAAEGFFRPHLEKLVNNNKHKKVKPYCDSRQKDFRFQAYRVAGDIYSRLDNYDKAIEFYLLADTPKCQNLAGQCYVKKGDLEKAVHCFRNGEMSPTRARAYRLYADFLKKQGNLKEAKDFYTQARNEFESIMKSAEFYYSDKDVQEWHLCRRGLAHFKKTPKEIAEKKLLKKILDKTSRYCQRLQTEMIHFFCKEDIYEIAKTIGNQSIENRFLYEYQLLKEKGRITEYRILLRHNEKNTKLEDAKLQTSTYQYNKLIIGPIGFFSRGWHDHFDYKILRKDKLEKRDVYVVEALPLRRLGRNFVAGRIWVDAKKFSVLRIEWEPKFFMANFNDILERAWVENADLKVAFISDFGVERNGIQFPSRYFIHEEIITPNNRRKTRAKLNVRFKDFKFFTVGTNVSYQN